MTKREQHINIEQIDSETKKLFSGGQIVWDKSKDSVWENMLETIKQEPQAKTVRLNQHILSFSVAASLILLIGISSFVWFFSKTITSPNGTHQMAQLPDGSAVEMNAGSILKYYPYRWIFSRAVIFDGEGFFEVEKGQKFEVKSAMGKTVVLGTSFNIYSRDDLYKVFCLTGKVRVIAPNKESVVISPNQQVVLKKGYELKKTEGLNVENVISWRKYLFRFTAVPFKEVVNEIERQYGITIRMTDNLNGILTCNFSKVTNVDDVLSVVCKPLGYKFVKQTGKNYLIFRSN